MRARAMSHTSRCRLRELSVLVTLLGSVAFSSLARSDCSPAQVDAPDSSIQVDPAARSASPMHCARCPSIRSILVARPSRDIARGTGIVLPADIAGRKAGQSADDVLRLLADVLMASGTESLSVRENSVAYGSDRELVLEQSIRGRPVLHSVVSLGYDASTRRVTTIVAHFAPDRELPPEPHLSARQAEQQLLRVLTLAVTRDPTGVVINDGTHLGYFMS